MKRRSWVWRAAAVAAGCAIAVGLAACGDDNSSSSDTSGSGGEITLTLSYVTTQQHPYGQAVDYFIEEVNKASNGRIKIEGRPSYPNSEVQLLSDVRSGSADMATISTAIWDSAGITSFQALQAPFLIDNYTLDSSVLTGSIGADMAADATEKAGDVKVLAVHEGGLRKPLGAKIQLTSAKAFKGAKIRAVQSKVLAAGLQALGAEADPLPLPEVYQALQNGTVDGMEANLGLIAGNKYYEVAKFVTGNINLWPFPTALVVNQAKFDSLSAEDQKILTDAGATVPAKSIEIVSAKSDLPQQLFDCGIRYVNASPADKAALVKLGEAAVANLTKADATTGDFIQQIKDLKANTTAPTPGALPTKKSAPDAKCALGG
ncbi:MAG: TRAP transporter substrate-binding protein [Thermoleophilia bacterium]|nr:TRAP transporter substrate-binding protein [Thermoleophilia bacterium]